MPTIAEILAGQEEEAATGTDLASIIATEREPSKPIGDPAVNRQSVADGHLTGTDPATVRLDVDRADAWIEKGADPSETVRSLLTRARAAVSQA